MSHETGRSENEEDEIEMAQASMDDVLEALETIRNPLRLTQLLNQLEWNDFVNDETRLDRLLRITAVLAASTVEERTKCEVLVAVTTLFISARVNETNPHTFDALVRFLWSLISDANTNIFETRLSRATACECLREIEMCLPNALEALGTPRSGGSEKDGKSLLERLVLQERTSAFENYLVLLITILSSFQENGPTVHYHPEIQTQDLGFPPSSTDARQIAGSVIHVVALTLESITLCSMWSRADLFAKMLLSVQVDDEALILFGKRASVFLTKSDHPALLKVLFDIVEDSCKLLEKGSSSSSRTDVETLVLRVNSLLTSIARCAHVDEEERIWASLRKMSGPYLQLNPSDSLPTPYQPIPIAIISAKTSLAQMRLHLSLSSTDVDRQITNVNVDSRKSGSEFERTMLVPPSDLLVSVLWFAEDFWRENPPAEITDAAFEVMGCFLDNFPAASSQVADVLVLALLRGGSRFFNPVARIFKLTGEDFLDKLVAGYGLECQCQDGTSSTSFRTLQILFATFTDAIADLPDDASLSEYFEILLVHIMLFPFGVSPRALSAIERYLSRDPIGIEWDKITTLLDCVRLGLSASVGRDTRTTKRLINLVKRIPEVAGEDPVVRDECDYIIRTARSLADGNEAARQRLRIVDHPIISRILNNSLRNGDCLGNDTGKSFQKRLVKRKTLNMGMIVSIKRSTLAPPSIPCEGSALVVPLVIEWMGGDAPKDALLGVQIYLVHSASTDEAFANLPAPVCVPLLSSTSQKFERHLKLEPLFPLPVRLSFRMIATDLDGAILEGSLADVKLELVDFFDHNQMHSPSSDVSTPLKHKTVVVRDQLTSARFDAFSRKVHREWLGLAAWDHSDTQWEVTVRIKPGYVMCVEAQFEEDLKRAVFRISSDDWILFGCIDDLFKIV